MLKIAEDFLLAQPVQLAREQGWFDRLVNAFRRQNEIILLGESGAGKTQFRQSLTQILPTPIDRMQRTKEVENSQIILNREPIRLIDPPGEKGKKSRRMEGVRDAIKKDYRGIINVVAYGYHEGRSRLDQIFDSNRNVKEEYLAECRQREIDQLHEWTAILGGAETDAFLITVVNKADLWWDQKEDVLNYYRSGPYHQALGEAAHLNPVVLSYCCVRKKFYGVMPSSGHFQEVDNTQLRSTLLTSLFRAVVGQDYAPPINEYTLPAEELEEYHELVDIELSGQLTPVQRARLRELEQILDDSDQASPLIQQFEKRTQEIHNAQMEKLNEAIAIAREVLKQQNEKQQNEKQQNERMASSTPPKPATHAD